MQKGQNCSPNCQRSGARRHRKASARAGGESPPHFCMFISSERCTQCGLRGVCELAVDMCALGKCSFGVACQSRPHCGGSQRSLTPLTNQLSSVTFIFSSLQNKFIILCLGRLRVIANYILGINARSCGPVVDFEVLMAVFNRLQRLAPSCRYRKVVLAGQQ